MMRIVHYKRSVWFNSHLVDFSPLSFAVVDKIHLYGGYNSEEFFFCEKYQPRMVFPVHEMPDVNAFLGGRNLLLVSQDEYAE